MRTFMAVLAAILVFSLCYADDNASAAGDANGDCRVNLLDAVQLLQDPAGACAAGDVNGDGRVSTTDGIYLLQHLFNHAPLGDVQLTQDVQVTRALIHLTLKMYKTL